MENVFYSNLVTQMQAWRKYGAVVMSVIVDNFSSRCFKSLKMFWVARGRGEVHD